MSSLLLTLPVNSREECGEWSGLWQSPSLFLLNCNCITDSLDIKACSHYNNADKGFSVKEATLNISCALCFFCFPFFSPPVTWLWCWADTFLAAKSMEQQRVELFYGRKGGKKIWCRKAICCSERTTNVQKKVQQDRWMKLLAWQSPFRKLKNANKCCWVLMFCMEILILST